MESNNTDPFGNNNPQLNEFNQQAEFTGNANIGYDNQMNEGVSTLSSVFDQAKSESTLASPVKRKEKMEGDVFDYQSANTLQPVPLPYVIYHYEGEELKVMASIQGNNLDVECYIEKANKAFKGMITDEYFDLPSIYQHIYQLEAYVSFVQVENNSVVLLLTCGAAKIKLLEQNDDETKDLRIQLLEKTLQTQCQAFDAFRYQTMIELQKIRSELLTHSSQINRLNNWRIIRCDETIDNITLDEGRQFILKEYAITLPTTVRAMIIGIHFENKTDGDTEESQVKGGQKVFGDLSFCLYQKGFKDLHGCTTYINTHDSHSLMNMSDYYEVFVPWNGVVGGGVLVVDINYSKNNSEDCFYSIIKAGYVDIQ